MELKNYIRDVVDFPKPGIIFKDITPLLGNAEAFNAMIDLFAKRYEGKGITKVCGIESRGFILGAALATKLGTGFVPVRKAGKLPHVIIKREYSLEYGIDAVEIHKDSVHPGEKVVLIDDLMATGGTALATLELLEELGAEIVEVAFAIELEFLKGRDKFTGKRVFSLLKY
ncbi:MAG: adenine phosphoribosyltransferase [Candidatus Rifleibacteriota bacterium]